MKNTIKALAAFVFLSLLFQSAKADTTVYAQLPTIGAIADVSGVKNVAGDPGFTWTFDSDSEAWAYFTATTTGKVNRVTWYGSNTDGAFAVDLFGATCFSCGMSFVQTEGQFATNLLTATGPFSGPSVTKTSIGSNMFAYSIALPTALTIQPGSSYGFSVVNNFSALPFDWAASASGSGKHINYVVGRAVVLPAPGNLAFALTYSAAPAPEPASWSLVILGVAAVGGALRSSRRRGAMQVA